MNYWTYRFSIVTNVHKRHHSIAYIENFSWSKALQIACNSAGENSETRSKC